MNKLFKETKPTLKALEEVTIFALELVVEALPTRTSDAKIATIHPTLNDKECD